MTGESKASGASRAVRLRVIGIAAAFVSLDFATKQIAVHSLEGAAPVRVIGSLLRFWVGRNPGAAFSMGADGSTAIFTVISSIAVVLICAFAPRLVSLTPAPGVMIWAVGLLLAGAAGNLVDRLVRAPGFGHGHVVDFIALPHFPIFNVSDMCITAAVVLYVIASVRATRSDSDSGGGS